MALMQLHVYSNILGMLIDVWVLMPEQLPQGGKKLKTLWLIDDGNNDCIRWAFNTMMERDAAGCNIAVILTGAYNSSFANMNQWHRYNEYIGEELPGIMHDIFPPLSVRREDSWISGFSNGIYDGLYVALTYPEVFGCVCLGAAGDKTYAHWSKKPSKESIFLDTDANMPNSDYCLKVRALRLIRQKCPLPRLFHFCGELDPCVDMNRAVRDFFLFLEGNPFDYSYAEIPGETRSERTVKIGYATFFDRMGFGKGIPI